MTTPVEYQNGGFIKYPDRVTTRTFFRATDRYTERVTVKQGQVLKKYSFVESIQGTADAGKVIAHRGIADGASVTFNNTQSNNTLALTSGQTLAITGTAGTALTFTAGSAGATAAQLAIAWSNIVDGASAATINAALLVAGIPTTVGVFSGAALSTWNTYTLPSEPTVVTFRGTTYLATNTDIAANGTGPSASSGLAVVSNVTITSSVILSKITGVLLEDVNATNGDVDATVYIEASFYAEALVWAVSASDYITDSLGNQILCTAYNTGVYGPDLATTVRMQKQFVENSEFSPLGFLSETATNYGTSFYV